MLSIKQKRVAEPESTVEIRKRQIKNWFFLSTIIAIAGLRCFVFRPIWVSNVGMSETIKPHDYLIVNRLAQIDRFEMIAFKTTDTSRQKLSYIGRVIGKPGDRLQYKDNQLIINGKKYDEQFLTKNQVTDDFELGKTLLDEKIPKGSYFILGDNRSEANDSRYFGYVKSSQIEGVIRLRLYPFNRVQRFD